MGLIACLGERQALGKACQADVGIVLRLFGFMFSASRVQPQKALFPPQLCPSGSKWPNVGTISRHWGPM